MEDVARRHGGRPDPGPGGGGADLISALPEDLLLQVLVRLRCARAAARTGLLSRRWRGLWTRLPDLVFRDLSLDQLLPALASLQAAAGPGVTLLDIRVAGLERDAALVSSLLHAAAGLSPAEFRLALPRDIQFFHAGMSAFHRAISIDLAARYLHLLLSRVSRFPALRRLSLSGCRVDLADLVLSCPCLRVLTVASGFLDSNIAVKSESLEELAVESLNKWTDCICVEAPMLKKLAMLFSTDNELSVSIVAPIVEKVSWECSYSYSTLIRGLGPWSLSNLSLHAAESLQDRDVYVLSLQIWPFVGLTNYHDAEFSLEQEMETHLVTGFSVLELHFTAMGLHHRVRPVRHVFGAFALHLIRSATRKLKIILQRSEFKEESRSIVPAMSPRTGEAKISPWSISKKWKWKAWKGRTMSLIC